MDNTPPLHPGTDDPEDLEGTSHPALEDHKETLVERPDADADDPLSPPTARSHFAPPSIDYEETIDDVDELVDRVLPHQQPTLAHGVAYHDILDAADDDEIYATQLDAGLSLTCPNCGEGITPDYRFCPHCALPLRTENLERCRNCNTPLIPHATYCFHCGSINKPIPPLTLRMIRTDIHFTLDGARPNYTIGRNVPQQNNFVDVDLGDYGQRKISRQHARVFFREGVWYLEDLNSKGGTRIFNDRLTPGEAVALEHGVVVYFAELQMQVEIAKV